MSWFRPVCCIMEGPQGDRNTLQKQHKLLYPSITISQYYYIPVLLYPSTTISQRYVHTTLQVTKKMSIIVLNKYIAGYISNLLNWDL